MERLKSFWLLTALVLVALIGVAAMLHPKPLSGSSSHSSAGNNATSTAAQNAAAQTRAADTMGLNFNVGMEKYIGTGANPIKNPSFEERDQSGQPVGWRSTHSGGNDAAFAYPVPGYQSASAAQVTVTSYQSGEAKWYPDEIPAQGGEAFVFSDYYKASTTTIVTAQFTNASGKASWMDLDTLPAAADWTHAVGAFYVPSGTRSFTVYHLLQSAGTLTTDDYSLSPIPANFSQGVVSINFDDGWESQYAKAFPLISAAHLPATFYLISRHLGEANYMTEQQALALQAAGEEIGAHTRNHPNLTKIAGHALESEIAGSLADLRAMGFNVSTFAYPYGAFDEKADAVVRSAGYSAARTVAPGLNFPESNRFLLKAHTVTNATSVAQVEAWIQEAVQDKQWLILLFHDFDSNLRMGDSYSWPSSDFKQIVDYLRANHVPVQTNLEVLREHYGV